MWLGWFLLKTIIICLVLSTFRIKWLFSSLRTLVCTLHDVVSGRHSVTPSLRKKTMQHSVTFFPFPDTIGAHL